MASAITGLINGSGNSYVTASTNVGTVVLTAKSGTTLSSLPISFTAGSDDTSDFPTGSYHATVAAPAYDSGKVTVSVNGFTTQQVSYSSTVNSSTTQMATALAAALNVAGSPVTASAPGSSITVNYGTIGTVGNALISISAISDNSSLFPAGSFIGSTTLSNGEDADPTGINHPLVTLYSYDALGNLLCVEQHGTAATGTGCSASPASDATSPWRVRRFTYDSLSRLLTASNPESNTSRDVNGNPARVPSTYAYDADGNLLQKASLLPNQTGSAMQTISYCYDALHRVTGKAYSAQNCVNGQLPTGTAVVSYTYDQGTNGIGHLTHVTDQAGSATYTYDNMGRIASETRIISGISKTISYDYNFDGSLKALHYPGNLIVTYTVGSAGRVTAVSDSNGTSYGNSLTYHPNGGQRRKLERAE